jgi:hypothetical protein
MSDDERQAAEFTETIRSWMNVSFMQLALEVNNIVKETNSKNMAMTRGDFAMLMLAAAHRIQDDKEAEEGGEQ